ncbi:hypothetical protein Q8W27_17425, partial [Oceanobacter sp. 2_MG-2023]|uniref:hypothetical protein n=1 Tax=Oceanobacter sp. 2_MG-2023 TaxID=3062619 RepID=UPI00273367F4
TDLHGAEIRETLVAKSQSTLDYLALLGQQMGLPAQAPQVLSQFATEVQQLASVMSYIEAFAVLGVWMLVAAVASV